MMYSHLGYKMNGQLTTVLTSESPPFYLSFLESTVLVIQTWSQSGKVIWEIYEEKRNLKNEYKQFDENNSTVGHYIASYNTNIMPLFL